MQDGGQKTTFRPLAEEPKTPAKSTFRPLTLDEAIGTLPEESQQQARSLLGFMDQMRQAQGLADIAAEQYPQEQPRQFNKDLARQYRQFISENPELQRSLEESDKTLSAAFEPPAGAGVPPEALPSYRLAERQRLLERIERGDFDQFKPSGPAKGIGEALMKGAPSAFGASPVTAPLAAFGAVDVRTDEDDMAKILELAQTDPTFAKIIENVPGEELYREPSGVESVLRGVAGIAPALPSFKTAGKFVGETLPRIARLERPAVQTADRLSRIYAQNIARTVNNIVTAVPRGAATFGTQAILTGTEPFQGAATGAGFELGDVLTTTVLGAIPLNKMKFWNYDRLMRLLRPVISGTSFAAGSTLGAKMAGEEAPDWWEEFGKGAILGVYHEIARATKERLEQARTQKPLTPDEEQVLANVKGLLVAKTVEEAEGGVRPGPTAPRPVTERPTGVGVAQPEAREPVEALPDAFRETLRSRIRVNLPPDGMTPWGSIEELSDQDLIRAAQRYGVTEAPRGEAGPITRAGVPVTGPTTTEPEGGTFAPKLVKKSPQAEFLFAQMRRVLGEAKAAGKPVPMQEFFTPEVADVIGADIDLATELETIVKRAREHNESLERPPGKPAQQRGPVQPPAPAPAAPEPVIPEAPKAVKPKPTQEQEVERLQKQLRQQRLEKEAAAAQKTPPAAKPAKPPKAVKPPAPAPTAPAEPEAPKILEPERDMQYSELVEGLRGGYDDLVQAADEASREFDKALEQAKQQKLRGKARDEFLGPAATKADAASRAVGDFENRSVDVYVRLQEMLEERAKELGIEMDEDVLQEAFSFLDPSDPANQQDLSRMTVGEAIDDALDQVGVEEGDEVPEKPVEGKAVYAVPINSLDEAIRQATRGFEGSEERIQKARERGATDEELRRFVSSLLGISGGIGGPKGGSVQFKGGENPSVTYEPAEARFKPNETPEEEKARKAQYVTLKGKALVKKVRELYNIPYPKAVTPTAKPEPVVPAEEEEAETGGLKFGGYATINKPSSKLHGRKVRLIKSRLEGKEVSVQLWPPGPGKNIYRFKPNELTVEPVEAEAPAEGIYYVGQKIEVFDKDKQAWIPARVTEVRQQARTYDLKPAESNVVRYKIGEDEWINDADYRIRPQGEAEVEPAAKEPEPVVPLEAEGWYKVQEVSLADINTQLDIFQNREEEYSEKTYDAIVNAVHEGTFIREKFDPLILWRNPKDGKLYVLAGHSRTAAARKLAGEGYSMFEKLPARVIEAATPEEAKQIATDSNMLGTRESPVARANAYRKMRDEGKPEAEIEAKAKAIEGKGEWLTAYRLSFLNKTGKLMDAVRTIEKSENADARGTIFAMGQWIGQIRKEHPELTNSHETEIFDYLQDNYRDQGAGFRSLGQFKEFVDGTIRVNEAADKGWAEKPLNLNRKKHVSGTLKQYDEQIAEQEAELVRMDSERKAREKELKEKMLRTGFVDPEKLAKLMAQQDELVRLQRQKIQMMKERRPLVEQNLADTELDLFAEIDEAERKARDAGATEDKIAATRADTGPDIGAADQAPGPPEGARAQDNPRIITEEQYREAKRKADKIKKDQAGELSLNPFLQGMDPELTKQRVIIGAYWFETGIRKFGEFYKKAVQEFGYDWAKNRQKVVELFEAAAAHWRANYPPASERARKQLTYSEKREAMKEIEEWEKTLAPYLSQWRRPDGKAVTLLEDILPIAVEEGRRLGIKKIYLDTKTRQIVLVPYRGAVGPTTDASDFTNGKWDSLLYRVHERLMNREAVRGRIRVAGKPQFLGRYDVGDFWPIENPNPKYKYSGPPVGRDLEVGDWVKRRFMTGRGVVWEVRMDPERGQQWRYEGEPIWYDRSEAIIPDEKGEYLYEFSEFMHSVFVTAGPGWKPYYTSYDATKKKVIPEPPIEHIEPYVAPPGAMPRLSARFNLKDGRQTNLYVFRNMDLETLRYLGLGYMNNPSLAIAEEVPHRFGAITFVGTWGLVQPDAKGHFTFDGDAWTVGSRHEAGKPPEGRDIGALNVRPEEEIFDSFNRPEGQRVVRKIQNVGNVYSRSKPLDDGAKFLEHKIIGDVHINNFPYVLVPREYATYVEDALVSFGYTGKVLGYEQRKGMDAASGEHKDYLVDPAARMELVTALDAGVTPLQEQKPAPYFSKLQSVVAVRLPEIGTAKQMLGALKNSDVSELEIRLTGVDEFLEARGNEKVTQAEVIEFLTSRTPIPEIVTRARLTDTEERLNAERRFAHSKLLYLEATHPGIQRARDIIQRSKEYERWRTVRKNPIVAAAIQLPTGIYTGKTHAEAIQKAIAAGNLRWVFGKEDPFGNVIEGHYEWRWKDSKNWEPPDYASPWADLFELKSGDLITRTTAVYEYAVTTAEDIGKTPKPVKAERRRKAEEYIKKYTKGWSDRIEALEAQLPVLAKLKRNQDPPGYDQSVLREPGGKDYKEIMWTLPAVGGPLLDAQTLTDPFKDVHGMYSSHKNLIGWSRTTNRTLPDGTLVLHSEENQSGWTQQLRAAGGLVLDPIKDRAKIRRAAKFLERLRAVEDSLYEPALVGPLQIKTFAVVPNPDLPEKIQDIGNYDIRKRAELFVDTFSQFYTPEFRQDMREFIAAIRDLAGPENMQSAHEDARSEAEHPSRFKDPATGIMVTPEDLGTRYRTLPRFMMAHPYRSSWVDLQIKGLVRQAVLDGASAISFTNAEQQEARNRITEYFTELSVMVLERDKEGKPVVYEISPIIGRDQMEGQIFGEEELDEAVGLELASEIRKKVEAELITDPRYRGRTTRVRVGPGEMKKAKWPAMLYGDPSEPVATRKGMIPEALRKFAKKWDAQIEEVELFEEPKVEVTSSAGRFNVVVNNNPVQPYVGVDVDVDVAEYVAQKMRERYANKGYRKAMVMRIPPKLAQAVHEQGLPSFGNTDFGIGLGAPLAALARRAREWFIQEPPEVWQGITPADPLYRAWLKKLGTKGQRLWYNLAIPMWIGERHPGFGNEWERGKVKKLGVWGIIDKVAVREHSEAIDNIIVDVLNEFKDARDLTDVQKKKLVDAAKRLNEIAPQDVEVRDTELRSRYRFDEDTLAVWHQIRNAYTAGLELWKNRDRYILKNSGFVPSANDLRSYLSKTVLEQELGLEPEIAQFVLRTLAEEKIDKATREAIYAVPAIRDFIVERLVEEKYNDRVLANYVSMTRPKDLRYIVVATLPRAETRTTDELFELEGRPEEEVFLGAYATAAEANAAAQRLRDSGYGPAPEQTTIMVQDIRDVDFPDRAIKLMSEGQLLDIVERAGVDSENPVVQKLLKELRTRGFQRHFERRKRSPGYPWDFDNLLKSVTEYVHDSARAYHKFVAAREAEKRLAEIRPLVDPQVYRYAQQWLENYEVTNPHEWEFARQIIYTTTLGLSPSHFVQNITQPIQTTWSDIALQLHEADVHTPLKTEQIFFAGYGKALQYLGYRIGKLTRTGLARIVPADELAIIERLRRQGVVSPLQIEQLAGLARDPRLRSPSGPKPLRIAKIGWRLYTDIMAMTGKVSEYINRYTTAFSAIKIGKEIYGLRGQDLVDYVARIVARTQFQFGQHNTPLGVIGYRGTDAARTARRVGKMAFILNNFVANWYSRAWDVHARTSWGAIWRHWAALVGLAGVRGLPMYMIAVALGNFLLGLIGDEETVEIKEREILQPLEQKLGLPNRTLTTGLPAFAGVETSRMLGLGDSPALSSADVTRMFAPLSLAKGTAEGMFDLMTTGELYTLATRGLGTPRLIRNLLRARKLSEEGYISGQGYVGMYPQELTDYDKGLLSTGFTPTDLAATYDMMQAERSIGRIRRMYEPVWMRQYVSALVKKDRAMQQRVMNDIARHNDSASLDNQVNIGAFLDEAFKKSLKLSGPARMIREKELEPIIRGNR